MRLTGFSKYEKYSSTDIQWFPEIPSSWITEKAKWLFLRAERPVRIDDEIVTCFRDGEVTLRANRRTEGFTNALKEHGYQGIRKGDLVIHAMDAFAGAIGISDSDGKSTPVYAACIPRFKNLVVPKFYAYYMRDLALSGFIVSLAKGIRERSSDFRFNDFANLPLPLPPLETQMKIVEFLDQKTAQIDEAIAIKEKQIELLKERKQVIIQKAVTQGLDPTVPMKDSGVDWIGEIPEHWKFKPLTKEVFVQEGPGIMAVDFHEEGVPLVRIAGVKTDTVTLESCNYLKPSKVRQKWEHFKLNKGDLVISGSASTELVSEVEHEADGAILYTGLIRVTPQRNSVIKDYLKIFFGTYLFFTQVDLQKTGSTISHYGPSHLSRIFILLPPTEEQKKIVDFTGSRKNETTEAVLIQELQIEKLKEYKTTLINNAVTGKIKVT
ncbi:MAG: restriction endonuclease subunit S [Pseudomonadota bacterium]